jgi:hypothetical protein
MAQAVQCLPSKHKPCLSLNPITTPPQKKMMLKRGMESLLLLVMVVFETGFHYVAKAVFRFAILIPQ